jgi:hypothetical protein
VAALNYVVVTGTFNDGTGQPMTGSATFTPSQPVYASGVPEVTPALPVTAEIVAGQLLALSGGPLQLLATDNVGLEVEGRTGFWFWEVSVSIGGEVTDTWQFFLPWATYGSAPYDGTVPLYATADTPITGA